MRFLLAVVSGSIVNIILDCNRLCGSTSITVFEALLPRISDWRCHTASVCGTSIFDIGAAGGTTVAGFDRRFVAWLAPAAFLSAVVVFLISGDVGQPAAELGILRSPPRANLRLLALICDLGSLALLLRVRRVEVAPIVDAIAFLMNVGAAFDIARSAELIFLFFLLVEYVVALRHVFF